MLTICTPQVTGSESQLTLLLGRIQAHVSYFMKSFQ